MKESKLQSEFIEAQKFVNKLLGKSQHEVAVVFDNRIKSPQTIINALSEGCVTIQIPKEENFPTTTPKEYLFNVHKWLAHELTHCVNHNETPRSSTKFEEGVCEYISYLYVESKSYENDDIQNAFNHSSYAEVFNMMFHRIQNKEIYKTKLLNTIKRTIKTKTLCQFDRSDLKQIGFYDSSIDLLLQKFH